jgi:hypothetical protein
MDEDFKARVDAALAEAIRLGLVRQLPNGNFELTEEGKRQKDHRQ